MEFLLVFLASSLLFSLPFANRGKGGVSKQKSLILLCLLGVFLATPAFAKSTPPAWEKEWPRTDFSKSSIDFEEIVSGGPPKDGIPAIDHPQFKPVAEISDLGAKEPVIALEVSGEAKAYPLRVLMWHEIANDTLGGVPITVTYCPLCNAGIVFDRRIDGKVLDFGVSGKLRHSDMIMYDRQTMSWWQQFLGEGIVGAMTGVQLKRLPSRILPFAEFKKTWPQGLVLVPENEQGRNYGANPYAKYDTSNWPFLFQGDYDGPIPALAYVIAVGNDAWPLEDIRKKKSIEHENIVIEWHEGMSSALDQPRIAEGRDIGYVTVQRKQKDGSSSDVAHDMTFAFVFKIFNPQGLIHAQ